MLNDRWVNCEMVATGCHGLPRVELKQLICLVATRIAIASQLMKLGGRPHGRHISAGLAAFLAEGGIILKDMATSTNNNGILRMLGPSHQRIRSGALRKRQWHMEQLFI